MQMTDTLDLLQSIRALVAKDMQAIANVIHRELASNVSLTREITQHIFKKKGKQLRPLLAMLSAHVFSQKELLSDRHHSLAVIIEFVHTATLLHDDVVDHSGLRRGQKTANVIWGNAASVLVGDFLYSRAFQMLARENDRHVMAVLSETTNALAEGEVMQLMNKNQADLTQENYIHVITQKTAKLFASAAQIGAILENANEVLQKAMYDYGLHLGIIFQIIDDLLDYETSSEITGKNIGDDLADGKATYPLIYAIQNTTPENAKIIRDAITNGDLNALPKILLILKETNAITATRQKALERAQLATQALDAVPDSIYRQALKELVEFAVERVT